MQYEYQILDFRDAEFIFNIHLTPNLKIWALGKGKGLKIEREKTCCMGIEKYIFTIAKFVFDMSFALN